MDRERGSSNCGMKESSRTVLAFVSRLVEHYDQPVHREPKIEVLSDNDIPPVIDHLLSELLDISQCQQTTILQLLQCYPNLIRPTLLNDSNHLLTTTVLEHYVLLLELFISKTADALARIETEKIVPSQRLTSSTSPPLSLSRLHHVLRSDITQLSASSSTESSKMAQKGISILWRLAKLMLAWQDPDEETTVNYICSLLAFSESVNVGEVEPSLPLLLCDMSQYSYWLYPSDLEVCLCFEEPMNWKDYSSDSDPWIQPLDDIWKLFANSTIGKHEAGVDVLETAVRKVVLARNDTLKLAKCIRAHFFGADTVDPANPQPQRHRLHLGHAVPISIAKEQEEKEHDYGGNKPFQQTPSRLHAVMAFLSLLDSNGVTSCAQHILNELVPICYELLNANDDPTIGKGAVVTFRLLKMITEIQHWRPFADNFLVALDRVILTCRNGCVLALVGAVQRLLLNSVSNAEYKIERRRATQKWLLQLDRNRHNPPDSKLTWGILMVVIPLLHDHGKLGDADGMDLGRLGLKALLPLVRLEYDADFGAHETSVPILSLLALSNLVVAAYPIMTRHTGKIICELVACICLTESVELSSSPAQQHNNRTAEVALRVAAMAVVVCGEKQTKSIGQTFQGRFDDRINDIFERVDALAASF